MNEEKILGVEGGGTKTAWVLTHGDTVLNAGRLPGCNLRLTTLEEVGSIVCMLPSDADRVGLFVAGCGTEADRDALLRLAQEIWPKAAVVVGSDRESGMAACLRDADGIVVNAGTGSSVTGRRGIQVELAGGWGHILGDTGGAYFVSIRALRVILRDYDLRRDNRHFASRVLSVLGLQNFDELVRWVQTAGKKEVASLAPIVFEAALHGEKPIERIINASAIALAEFASAVGRRLELAAPDLRLMGGLFEHQSSYVAAFRAAAHKQIPAAQIALADTRPEMGAVWLARKSPGGCSGPPSREATELVATTEQPNPDAEKLDTLSAGEIVELFIKDQEMVKRALRRSKVQLAQAIELATFTVGNGGRVFYVGAGTSGRLGVLDAAEIPPTFGVSPEVFQGIIAGGPAALQASVEGAEDDETEAATALEGRNLGKQDLVIGISASGGARFVLGALHYASELGSKTILLTCNSNRERDLVTDLTVELETGPEIVAGSTRLKAGTATKIVLNIISTGTMVRLGRVHGPWMIDLQPVNEKLKARAVRLLAHLTGCGREAARRRLESASWNVRAALKG